MKVLRAPEIGPQDVYLFNEGTHLRAWEILGAHRADMDGRAGTIFSVWAPDAATVSVVGDFNGWNRGADPMEPQGTSGIWRTFVPGAGTGAIYKYHVVSRLNGRGQDKADPYAFATEVPPRTGSVVWEPDYDWSDSAWMRERSRRNAADAPWTVYEVHLGSWMRSGPGRDRWLTYRDLAPRLAEYATSMGYTHIELLPVMEHPFYGSWGYQTTGYFAPTRRYGDPQDLMYMIDTLHRAGVGVILDWVPSHFPCDLHGLAEFDGSHLYEHADPRLGFHPDWKSCIFNYGRREVRSFLLSSALFWLETYHADALRVDAVASMLYLDYSRLEGEWVPNRHGGRENLEAIDLLRALNESAYRFHPDTQTVAEESTAWPGVSRPTYGGGLGFGMKWDMGWMHDTLEFFAREPVYRRYHHGELTFRSVYAFSENFMLPLSHDEVVHGKRSLLGRMPGDLWQRLANLRLLYAYMYGQPGKKLLFMGDDIAQWREWDHDSSVDWHLLQDERHAGIQRWVRDLNRAVLAEPALHRMDFDPEGFRWIGANDAESGVLSFLRCAPRCAPVMVVLNLTPVPRYDYRVGAPAGGFWRELLNSDASVYGGSGVGNMGGVHASDRPWNGMPCSIEVAAPPLAGIFLRYDG